MNWGPLAQQDTALSIAPLTLTLTTDLSMYIYRYPERHRSSHRQQPAGRPRR